MLSFCLRYHKFFFLIKIWKLRVDKVGIGLAITFIELSRNRNYLHWVTNMEVFLKAKWKKRFMVMYPLTTDDKSFEEWEKEDA